MDLIWPDREHLPGYREALEQGWSPDTVRGKIVIVGVSAPSLQDVHQTPTTLAMSGPELQANSIATVLRGFPLGVSSSQIRARVKAGLPIQHLTPWSVAEAIRQNRLYL